MRDALVLCYHAVSEAWTAPLSVTPENLEWQVRGLAERGYRGTTVSQVLGGETETERVAAVTFDDAYRSVLELAEPILSKYGFVATVFAPTGLIETNAPASWPGVDRWLGGPHEPELTLLSWGEMDGLQARGWEIGSHTVSHPRLTELGSEQLAAELQDSKAVCEAALGTQCAAIAYPYGDHDARVVAAARAAGYTCGLTLPSRLHPVNPLRWPRIGIYHADGRPRFALKTSAFVRRARSRLDRAA